MKSLRFPQTGSLENLKIEDVPTPVPAPGEALVQVKAAAVNPSASNPDPRVSFNLVDFYHRELRLFGVDSVKIAFEEAAEILRGLTPGIEDGTFQPPATRTVSFSRIIDAYGPKV